MIFQTYEDFLPQLNTLLSKIQKDFASEINNSKNNSKQITKKYNNKLYEYLDQGKIKYTGTYFIGTFTKDIITYLTKQGAMFNKRGAYLPYERLNITLKQFIRKQKQLSNASLKVYQNKINNYNFSIFNNYLINNIAESIFKKLVLSMHKEGLNTNINLSFVNSFLSDNVLKNFNNIKEYLISQLKNINTNQSIDVINKIILNKFNFCIKNELYNATNKLCYNVLSNTCKDNGINYFYWWHRPTKRPSDRTEHRKHYQASLQGKKFYFNNLPKYNGEEDYPAKLWNCHCRIYVSRKDFMEARE